MSKSKKKGSEKSFSVSLSQKEMVRIYGKIHSLLAKRLRDAKKQNDIFKGRDKKLKRKYADSAKELYAYVRLMELCQNLSKDSSEMRDILETLSKNTLLYATHEGEHVGKPN